MIENYINITLHRKKDIDAIELMLRKLKIDSPIFILEFESNFKINFTSEYEQWELENSILNIFTNYEFIEDLGNGKKEIIIQLSRNQSPFSTDDWGRPLESIINQTKYLVKKTDVKIEKFNPEIKVLFEDSDEYYYLNIINGKNKLNNETGFLLLDEFRKFDKSSNIGFYRNELFHDPQSAFWAGVNKINEIAESDFKKYLSEKKKNQRKKRK